MIVWFLYWFAIWGVFNLVLIPHNISFIRGGVKSSIFFLFLTLITALFIPQSVGVYFFGLVLVQILPDLIIGKKIYPERNLLTDVVFQQSMIYWLFVLTKQADILLHLGIFMACLLVSHLPIFTLKHTNISGKILIYSILPIASGLMFISLYKFSLPVNIMVNIFFHFSFYYYLVRWRKDNNWGILI